MKMDGLTNPKRKSIFISITHNAWNRAFVGADRVCNAVQNIQNEQNETEKKNIHIFYLILGSVDESYTGEPFKSILTSFLKPWHDPCGWCFL